VPNTNGTNVTDEPRTNDCQDCDEGTYLHEGKCLANCPETTFANGGTNTCDQCGDHCLKCETEYACDECEEGMFLDGLTCVEKCSERH